MTDLLDRPPPEPAGSRPGPPTEPESGATPDGRPLELEPSSPAPDDADGRDERWLERILTIAMVASAVVFTVSRMHPDLLFRDTTPAGGDFGAHVWGPAYLRDHLLADLRISGWSPDWYAGFPMYRFYMVVPALAVVLIDLVAPYGVALKLISLAGIAGLPLAAWAFGRLAGARFPIPGLLAMMAVVFLFDETFTIYGGNIASTMAGEFSFAVALCLALVYLGLLAHGLRTGRHAATTAVVLALAALCHGIVAMAFLTVGSAVVFFVYADWSRVRRTVLYTAVVGVVGGLLTAFWMIPFLLGHAYMTDMGYERREDYWQMLFPQPLWLDRVLFVLALAGLIGSIVRRRRLGIALGAMVVVYMVWVPLQPQGMLWNARLLPFLYLCRYFLVAIGAVEVALVVGRHLGLEAQSAIDRRASRWGGISTDAPWRTAVLRRSRTATTLTTAVVGSVLVLFLMGMQQQILPGGREVRRDVTIDGETTSRYGYQWGPFGYTWGTEDKPGFVDNWAEWNYAGYEGKPAYGEYYGIVTTMRDLGLERGCGRALWENNNDLDKYGTPMALMLLPFWTDGCIGSMEGLFFEASGTTPYHFLTAAALSDNASNPVRDLRYENADLDTGVQEAKLLGVRYYLAFTPSIVARADAHPELTPVATSGPWHVYEIAGAGALVTPLRYDPVVVEGIESRRDWLILGTSFFQDPSRYDVMPAADGPDDWARVTTVETSPTPEGTETLPVVGLSDVPVATPLPEVAVSDIRTGDQGLSFRVDQVGVPVLVKVSYFPNWSASGAEGPYRVAPNLMVVIPTENEVSLSFGMSGTDRMAWVLTILGLGLAVLVALRGRRWFADRPPPSAPGAGDDVADTPVDDVDPEAATAGWAAPPPSGRAPRPLDVSQLAPADASPAPPAGAP